MIAHKILSEVCKVEAEIVVLRKLVYQIDNNLLIVLFSEKF